MGLLNSLSNTTAPLVLDASVIINLNASGFATDILKALPNRAAVVDNVLSEIGAGKDRGRHDGRVLNDLISAGILEKVTLGETGAGIFAGLVTGRTAETLDDGEAATIAYAIQQGAVAVIDERKANRICAERFPALHVVGTTDLFMHPLVVGALKREQLIQCVTNALKTARMRIFQEHVSWVVDLIGAEEAKTCLSLPRSVRST